MLRSAAQECYRGSLPECEPPGAIGEGVVAVGDQVELVSGWVVVAVYAKCCHLYHADNEPLPRRSTTAGVGVVVRALLPFPLPSPRLVELRRSDRGQRSVRFPAGRRKRASTFKS